MCECVNVCVYVCLLKKEKEKNKEKKKEKKEREGHLFFIVIYFRNVLFFRLCVIVECLRVLFFF